MRESVDPFGRTTRRSSRLSDEETASRMLSTGKRLAHESGLQLSFDLLRLEDIIEAANVSRSAVYRRWPSKAHYFADLLLELAGQTHPATAAYSVSTLTTACDIAQTHIDALRTPLGRKVVVVEMCRQGALENFRTITDGREWSTYVALQATLLSLPKDLALEERMRSALRNSEQAFVKKMAAFYAGMVGVVGYRLRNIDTLTYETIATLGAALVEGLAVNTLTVPEVGDHSFTADPFGTGSPDQWSLPALGFASIIMTLVEPEEPEALWDDARIEQSRRSLREIRSTASEMQTEE